MIESTTSQDYLHFLRYCLSPNIQSIPECAVRIDWTGLLQFAIKQSIVGICWQGVKRMGCLEENKPTEDDVLEWMAEISKIEKQNRKVNAVAAKVVIDFQRHGFDACVLKGQGNALLYPTQSLRTPGDIDLYVHPQLSGGTWENDDVAVRHIIAFCKSIDSSARAVYHHIDIPTVDKVPVEVHYRPTWMNNPKHNKRLQSILAILLSQKEGNKKVSLPDDAGQIVTPGFQFNVIFQLSHILNHLLHEGVGLRQLIDYYYLLQLEECNTQEKTFLNEELSACGLLRIGSAVSWVLEEVFGLQETYLITNPNGHYGQQLLHEMLTGGNFGKFDDRKLSGTYNSRLMANIQRLIRDVRMVAYYPSECLWEPWFRVWHWWWRKKHN